MKRQQQESSSTRTSCASSTTSGSSLNKCDMLRRVSPTTEQQSGTGGGGDGHAADSSSGGGLLTTLAVVAPPTILSGSDPSSTGTWIQPAAQPADGPQQHVSLLPTTTTLVQGRGGQGHGGRSLYRHDPYKKPVVPPAAVAGTSTTTTTCTTICGTMTAVTAHHEPPPVVCGIVSICSDVGHAENGDGPVPLGPTAHDDDNDNTIHSFAGPTRHAGCTGTTTTTTRTSVFGENNKADDTRTVDQSSNNRRGHPLTMDGGGCGGSRGGRGPPSVCFTRDDEHGDGACHEGTNDDKDDDDDAGILIPKTPSTTPTTTNTAAAVSTVPTDCPIKPCSYNANLMESRLQPQRQLIVRQQKRARSDRTNHEHIKTKPTHCPNIPCLDRHGPHRQHHDDAAAAAAGGGNGDNGLLRVSDDNDDNNDDDDTSPPSPYRGGDGSRGHFATPCCGDGDGRTTHTTTYSMSGGACDDRTRGAPLPVAAIPMVYLPHRGGPCMPRQAYLSLLERLPSELRKRIIAAMDPLFHSHHTSNVIQTTFITGTFSTTSALRESDAGDASFTTPSSGTAPPLQQSRMKERLPPQLRFCREFQLSGRCNQISTGKKKLDHYGNAEGDPRGRPRLRTDKSSGVHDGHSGKNNQHMDDDENQQQIEEDEHDSELLLYDQEHDANDLQGDDNDGDTNTPTVRHLNRCPRVHVGLWLRPLKPEWATVCEHINADRSRLGLRGCRDPLRCEYLHFDCDTYDIMGLLGAVACTATPRHVVLLNTTTISTVLLGVIAYSRDVVATLVKGKALPLPLLQPSATGVGRVSLMNDKKNSNSRSTSSSSPAPPASFRLSSGQEPPKTLIYRGPRDMEKDPQEDGLNDNKKGGGGSGGVHVSHASLASDDEEVVDIGVDKKRRGSDDVKRMSHSPEPNERPEPSSPVDAGKQPSPHVHVQQALEHQHQVGHTHRNGIKGDDHGDSGGDHDDDNDDDDKEDDPLSSSTSSYSDGSTSLRHKRNHGTSSGSSSGGSRSASSAHHHKTVEEDDTKQGDGKKTRPSDIRFTEAAATSTAVESSFFFRGRWCLELEPGVFFVSLPPSWYSLYRVCPNGSACRDRLCLFQTHLLEEGEEHDVEEKKGSHQDRKEPSDCDSSISTCSNGGGGGFFIVTHAEIVAASTPIAAPTDSRHHHHHHHHHLPPPWIPYSPQQPPPPLYTQPRQQQQHEGRRVGGGRHRTHHEARPSFLRSIVTVTPPTTTTTATNTLNTTAGICRFYARREGLCKFGPTACGLLHAPAAVLDTCLALNSENNNNSTDNSHHHHFMNQHVIEALAVTPITMDVHFTPPLQPEPSLIVRSGEHPEPSASAPPPDDHYYDHHSPLPEYNAILHYQSASTPTTATTTSTSASSLAMAVVGLRLTGYVAYTAGMLRTFTRWGGSGRGGAAGRVACTDGRSDDGGGGGGDQPIVTSDMHGRTASPPPPVFRAPPRHLAGPVTFPDDFYRHAPTTRVGEEEEQEEDGPTAVTDQQQRQQQLLAHLYYSTRRHQTLCHHDNTVVGAFNDAPSAAAAGAASAVRASVVAVLPLPRSFITDIMTRAAAVAAVSLSTMATPTTSRIGGAHASSPTPSTTFTNNNNNNNTTIHHHSSTTTSSRYRHHHAAASGPPPGYGGGLLPPPPPKSNNYGAMERGMSQSIYDHQRHRRRHYQHRHEDHHHHHQHHHHHHHHHHQHHTDDYNTSAAYRSSYYLYLQQQQQQQQQQQHPPSPDTRPLPPTPQQQHQQHLLPRGGEGGGRGGVLRRGGMGNGKRDRPTN